MRTLNRAIGRRRKAVYADRIEKFTPGSIMLLIFVCISLRRRLQNLAIRKFQFGQIHRNDALNIRPIITLQHGDGGYPKRIVTDQSPESVDQADARQRVDFVHGRSEERRVGKECRSRWWPYHEKKKQQD